MKKNKGPIILLTEDSDEDYEMTRRALEKANLDNTLFRCVDGEDTLSYLVKMRQDDEEKVCPRPDLILLDLNLPGTDGREVLVHLKKIDCMKTIPVIILTTSFNERDIQQCYLAGANSYIVKPIDFFAFMRVIQCMYQYWFKVTSLPRST